MVGGTDFFEFYLHCSNFSQHGLNHVKHAWSGQWGSEPNFAGALSPWLAEWGEIGIRPSLTCAVVELEIGLRSTATCAVVKLEIRF